MNLETLGLLVTAILTVTAVAGYALKTRKLLVEIKELFVAIIDASTDETISADEIRRIVKEARDIPMAVKAVFAQHALTEGSFCLLIVVYALVLVGLLTQSGCGTHQLTPRQSWAVASASYQQTVKSVLLLHDAGHLSDKELVDASVYIELAHNALDEWQTALLSGTPPAEAIGRFTENLDKLITCEQNGKERQANGSADSDGNSVSGTQGCGVVYAVGRCRGRGFDRRAGPGHR